MDQNLTSTGSEERRWALVTGASAGIGAEFCQQLAARGYNIVLVARRKERMEEISELLKQEHGVQTVVLSLDLADVHACEVLAEVLAQEKIEVEFLVNNAGYGVAGGFNEAEWPTHTDFLQVMLNSVCELTHRLLPGMQQRGRGYIINVASLAALLPGAARNTLYGAAKSFLVKFSESLAAENRDTGVKISALCPGFTYSEFHDVLDIREQVSQMPSWMWMEAEPVVQYGIESVMRKRPRVVGVPGKANRFIAWLARLLPAKLARWMTNKAGEQQAQPGKYNRIVKNSLHAAYLLFGLSLLAYVAYKLPWRLDPNLWSWTPRPLVLLNVLPVALVALFILCLTRRLYLSATAVGCLVYMVFFVNGQKLEHLEEPVVFTDFLLLPQAFTGFDLLSQYVNLFALTTAVVAFIGVIYMLWKWEKPLAGPKTGMALSLVSLLLILGLSQKEYWPGSLYHSDQLAERDWHPVENVKLNGLIATLARSSANVLYEFPDISPADIQRPMAAIPPAPNLKC